MRKVFKTWVLLCMVFLLALPMEVHADGGYQVILQDDADLLTEGEEAELITLMKSVTEYGNAAFVSVSTNYASTDSFAENFYYSNFGNQSGVVFIIDMDNRNIWIETDGAIKKRIDKDYAEVITDNTYQYATNGDYFECARQSYLQIQTLLEGGRIAQPMKYICNVLLALSVAMIINFLVMRAQAANKAPKKNARLEAVYHYCDLIDPQAIYMRQERKYSPQSSGGGGRSGGGGGGGGGSSSGGGHSF
ncbi:MAG: TPM domain-containing protein [Lachnospiraceae bacterium]|nr:TPM domain-containing protein [Lachnospiraceae bacterium]